MNAVSRSIPFLLQRPAYLKNDTSDDNVIFYNNIEAVLKEWKYPYTVTRITNKTAISESRKIPKYNGILLSFHSSYSKTNLWNLKKGYVPLYMNFDCLGFSGWSEMAKSKQLFDISQQMDVNKATKFVNSFVHNYAATGVSKYRQSSESFNLDKPFLFVACQRPHDAVSRLARIDTYKLASLVAHELSSIINIVIKLHPKEIKCSTIKHLEKLPNVQFSNASIHELIPKSAGVITVNSGVGFEALLYGKHVFTAGGVDYHWVTHILNDRGDIIDIPNKIILPPKIDSINKFLFYIMTNHFVKADNINSIKKHLQRAIDEYKITIDLTTGG